MDYRLAGKLSKHFCKAGKRPCLRRSQLINPLLMPASGQHLCGCPRQVTACYSIELPITRLRRQHSTAYCLIQAKYAHEINVQAVA
ncbi:hypothetical protein D3C87_1842230 [compost metagenome]